jgi:TolA-binding protein
MSKKSGIFIVLMFLLSPIKGAMALNLGQILSGAGSVARGMQESENRTLQNRMLELQIQEANRIAVIQQLEYQRRIKELDEARQMELKRQQRQNLEALQRERAQAAELQAQAAAQAQTVNPAASQAPQMQMPVDVKLAEIAERLRKLGTKELDNGVSLMGVAAKENKLFLMVMLHSINVKSDPYKKVNEVLQNQISEAIVTTCMDKMLEPLTRNDAVIRYSYFDVTQSFIEGIDTDKSDCAKLYDAK